MYWWQLGPMPNNRERLRSLIDEELDTLAQLEQFPDFLTKLTATIATFFKDPNKRLLVVKNHSRKRDDLLDGIVRSQNKK
jgi:hypothetical protein